MVWNLIILIGVLFIINGLFSMGHSRTVENVKKQMPKKTEIYYGGSRGLLFMPSTDVMLAVQNNGNILKAFSIKSGWLRLSKAEELKLSGCRIQSLEQHVNDLPLAQQKACKMAVRQYQRKKKA